MEPNLATFQFPEAKQHGLMICGIEWGHAKNNAEHRHDEPTFFSDASIYQPPYQKHLVRWFEFFGHRLIQEKGKEGPFERSILQTNWLAGEAPNTHGRDIPQECIKGRANFFFHIETFHPWLIVFLSVNLLDVLNKPECLPQAKKLFGDPISGPDIHTKTVEKGEKSQRQFHFGFQRFAETDIIALPHPSGSIGLSNAYVQAFADEVGPYIQRYKERRGF